MQDTDPFVATAAQVPVRPGAGPVLRAEGLQVSYGSGDSRVAAVRGLSLELHPGRCLALVGGSGSGKSTAARALVGLAGPQATVTADRLRLITAAGPGGEGPGGGQPGGPSDGIDLLALSGKQWPAVRGRHIGLVLQDALTSLDPLRLVGAEVTEALRNHRLADRADLPRRAVELLAEVHVPQPQERARQFPHQLSGGLRQRALIASALAAGPPVLIADEPTTALDVSVQAQILALLDERKRTGTALLLISHDLAVVSRLADRVIVLEEGVPVEEGETAQVLRSPTHAYTKRLIAAIPGEHPRGTRLSDPAARTVSAAIPLPGPRSGRFPTAAAGTGTGAGPVRSAGADGTRPAEDSDAPLLAAAGLAKHYRLVGGQTLTAVADLSLEIRRGEAVGLVGESGSGKSTAAGLLLGLVEPDAGQVRLLGHPWSGRAERDRRPLRRLMQTVAQDPLSSFDPRWTVERIVAEALPNGGWRGRSARADVSRLLDQVGLSPILLTRRPGQLSGGQLQRVAIARALAPGPAVLVCDEPVSALDVLVQAQVLDLLADLRDELGLALLFISHDLGVVHHLCDRVLVMYQGRVVEQGPVEEVFGAPVDPYTRSLLEAVPRLDPGSEPRP